MTDAQTTTDDQPLAPEPQAAADAPAAVAPGAAGTPPPGDPGAEAGGPGSLEAEAEHLKPILEALVFASPEPLTIKDATALLAGEATRAEIEAAIALLRHDYERAGGLQLVEVAGGYQIVTRPDLHEYVRRLFHERTSQKLSVQALETLAVIAYRQPVTAPEIAEIRGVNTAGVLNTLIGRKLVKIVGRKQVVGRPFMYGTTREFLDKFGLNDISDLPKVEDLADVLGFEPPLMAEAGPAERPLSFDFGHEEAAAGGTVQADAPVPDDASAASAPRRDTGD
jgi:segregation and condensation protein B